MERITIQLTSQYARLRKETCRAILFAHDDNLTVTTGPRLTDFRICRLAIDIGVGIQFVDVVADTATRCN